MDDGGRGGAGATTEWSVEKHMSPPPPPTTRRPCRVLTANLDRPFGPSPLDGGQTRGRINDELVRGVLPLELYKMMFLSFICPLNCHRMRRKSQQPLYPTGKMMRMIGKLWFDV